MSSSAIWAAYAAAIATLASPAGLGLTSSQRFAINPQNSYSIPVVPFVNQLYQNWNVYQYGSVVPTKDIGVLVDSGQNYDTAYGLYLDNVFLQVPHDPRLVAQINETATKMSNLRVEIQDLKRKAQSQYMTDVPNGIDPFTGETMRLSEYAERYFPEIKNKDKTLARLEGVRFELENTLTGGAQRDRLVSWREALAKGVTQNSSFPNYNMPVVAAEEAVIQQVANGSITVNGQPTSYEPVWQIQNFNRVAKQWIDTFPSEYPFNRRRYDQGKSSYSTVTVSLDREGWTKFGYGSRTQSTGSSGWFFWKKKNTATNTWSTTNININESSFKSGITVNVWGIGTFPISMGQWYQGNPFRTWPALVQSAPKSTSEDIKEQITSVVVAYGVETIFTLEKSAFETVVKTINTARSEGGSLSIFGSLYGTSDGSHSSTFESWSNIKTHSENNTVVLLAHHNKVPTVLGTTITSKFFPST